MENKGYGYQYETSPRKLEPEYKKPKKKNATSKKPNQVKQKQNKKSIKNKSKKKFKMSFEMKFFIHSMLFFAIIFAIIACQALVEQRYKEKESLKQQYNELLSKSNMNSEQNNDIRVTASEYGMQTKSATLINLETSDYIESSVDESKMEKDNFFDKIINWIKEKF